VLSDELSILPPAIDFDLLELLDPYVDEADLPLDGVSLVRFASDLRNPSLNVG